MKPMKHRLTTMLLGGWAAIAALWVSSAHAQFASFGREYLRYSMYGSGPYGYGSIGYYKAIAPEPPVYHDVRDWESDYGYEPHVVYDGTSPSRATVERRARKVPPRFYDPLVRPEQYPPYRAGYYAPNQRFIYGFGRPPAALQEVGQGK